MMAMIDTRICDGVGVVRVKGEMRYGAEAHTFRRAIDQLIDDHVFYVVVDLNEMVFCGSPMLGVLAASFSTLRRRGGAIRLVGVSDRIRDMMAVTRLAIIFKVDDSIETAIEGLLQKPNRYWSCDSGVDKVCL